MVILRYLWQPSSLDGFHRPDIRGVVDGRYSPVDAGNPIWEVASVGAVLP
jgi:hypothetical protein